MVAACCTIAVAGCGSESRPGLVYRGSYSYGTLNQTLDFFGLYRPTPIMDAHYTVDSDVDLYMRFTTDPSGLASFESRMEVDASETDGPSAMFPHPMPFKPRLGWHLDEVQSYRTVRAAPLNGKDLQITIVEDFDQPSSPVLFIEVLTP
jgi:hypothetical protein